MTISATPDSPAPGAMTDSSTADLTATCDGAGTFHNGARGRFNAWFFSAFDRYINFISRKHKRKAFADIRRGDVVEIGPGVGANFAFVPHGSRLFAVEPNEAMHPALVRRAAERGVDLELIEAPAEALPFPDSSVDEVICSLVLCTVEDSAATIAEVLRVLRPGGTFRFVEHVAAHPASPRRWIQAAIARPWSWIYEGCRLCRDTGRLIEHAGFSDADIDRHRFRQSVFFPVNSAISGRATK